MPDAPSALGRPGIDLVRESVNRLWRWSRDLIFRGRDDFLATRSAILLRPERCELYHIRVEIHQKSSEPVGVSTKCYQRGSRLVLTLQMPRPGFSQSSLFQYAPRALHKAFFSLRGEPQPGQPSHHHRPRGRCQTNIRSLLQILLRRLPPRGNLLIGPLRSSQRVLLK